MTTEPTSRAQRLTDLLGDTRARVLEAVQRAPSTAGAIAEEIGITPAAVRRHLGALRDDRLVAAEAVHDGSTGRPADTWTLTPRGRRLFADRSAEFADELMSHLADTYGRGAVAAFLKDRNSRKAAAYAEAMDGVADPAERADLLAGALSADGFAARVVRPGDGGRSLTLLQSHCAIEDIAREHPEICAHEAALFREVLGAKVSRRQTIASGASACVCHIDLDPTTHDPRPHTPTSDRSA